MTEIRKEKNEVATAFRKFTRLGLWSEKLRTFDAYARIKGCCRNYDDACALLAVYDTLRLLKFMGNTETIAAVREIYCRSAGKKPKKSEISMRILRFAWENHCDERTVYRRLEYAKRLYRQLRYG